MLPQSGLFGSNMGSVQELNAPTLVNTTPLGPDLCPPNAGVQLQAASKKACGSTPLQLNLKETNCDGYLEHRA
jgi:hypothetical protein